MGCDRWTLCLVAIVQALPTLSTATHKVSFSAGRAPLDPPSSGDTHFRCKTDPVAPMTDTSAAEAPRQLQRPRGVEVQSNWGDRAQGTHACVKATGFWHLAKLELR